MEAFFIVLSLLAGAVLALQAGANAQLSKAIGSAFAATTLQLSVGAVVLALLMMATETTGKLALLPRVEWWHAIGGAASAFYVVSTILLFPRLGAIVSVGLLIAGQMLASLTLDWFGLLGIPATGLDAGAVAGTIGVLLGAALIVVGQSGSDSFARPANLGWIALALAAGVVLPAQAALNALLKADLDDAPFAVATVSFVVATVTMAAVLIGSLVWTPTPRPVLSGLRTMPWWGWLGGFAGATYVTTMFTALPAIGVAATVGLTIAGQQIASVLVDKFGWFRLPARAISRIRLTGVVLIILGVVAIKTS